MRLAIVLFGHPPFSLWFMDKHLTNYLTASFQGCENAEKDDVEKDMY